MDPEIEQTTSANRKFQSQPRKNTIDTEKREKVPPVQMNMMKCSISKKLYEEHTGKKTQKHTHRDKNTYHL